MIISFWIINRAGGLQYYYLGGDELIMLENDDNLMIASTFLGMNALAGLDLLNSGSEGSHIRTIRPRGRPFFFYCLHSLTGLKFIFKVRKASSTSTSTSILTTASSKARTTNTPTTQREDDNVKTLSHKIHLLYSNWVLKNPLQMLDMPIKNERFDHEIRKTINAFK